MSGPFISFEGGEGSGKSTQAALLTARLRQDGRTVLHTREPGGSAGAERLRTLLLAGDHGLCLRSEVLLLLAARRDHLERTILPALADGVIVICDRFADSTLAYQGYGLGHGDASVLGFIRAAGGLVGPMPTLTLLLELDAARASQRVHARQVQTGGGAPDRYEALDAAFHARVAAGFRTIADAEPARIVRIDAAPPPEQVQAAVLALVRQRLG